MTELLSYIEWTVAFVVGNLSGIFIYRELFVSKFPLNNSSNKTSKTNKEQNKMNEV